jgi:hypothetical protein
VSAIISIEMPAATRAIVPRSGESIMHATRWMNYGLPAQGLPRLRTLLILKVDATRGSGGDYPGRSRAMPGSGARHLSAPMPIISNEMSAAARCNRSFTRRAHNLRQPS